MHTENANNELLNTVQLVQQEAYDLLRSKAAELGFSQILRQSFGPSYDDRAAEALIQKWEEGIFCNLPSVQIQNLDQLDNANGAFASSTQTIYISDSLLQQAQRSGDITGAVGVFLEEVGHFIDDLLNPLDTSGDEGELFSALVRDVSLTEDQLSTLYVENDQAILSLGDADISVEMSQIAQAVFNNRLYQSHRGKDNAIYTRYSLDSTGTSWSAWDQDGGNTPSAPDLEAFNGRLYQVHRGMDNRIYLRYSTDALATNWSGWQQFGGTTSSTPTLEVFNNRLFMSIRGTDDKIYTRYSLDSTGTSWSAWDQDGGVTPSAPDLEAFNGRLYQVHRGMDNRIYLRYSTDALATNWSGWQQFGGTTSSAPTLEVFNSRLFMSIRGTDDKIYTRYSDSTGTSWSAWDQDGGVTPSAPYLAVFNGRLFQAHQGMDEKIYSRYSLDTLATSWSGWREFGGLTPAGADDTPMTSPPPQGNPDIDIRLDYYGSFTQVAKDAIERAAQNWENIITKDKVSSGVLQIAVTQGSQRWNGASWGTAWAITTWVPYQYQQQARYDLTDGSSSSGNYAGQSRMQFNSYKIGSLSSYQLTRLATHEIGHALGLHEAQYDSSLGMNGIMDSDGLDPYITEGVYSRLEWMGYSVNRNASVSWG